MFTKIERKVYDESGTETILGLPCKTVIDYWDGSINSNRFTVEDLFNIDDINIEDGHSTGAISLLSRILEVKLQERLIPTTLEIKSGFKGPVIATDKTVDWNDLQRDTLVEITNLGINELNEIPIFKAYKCTGEISYATHPNMNILLDNRETMDTYTTKNWDDCVYISLPKSTICENGQLKDWAKKLLPSDANPINYSETTDDWGNTTNNGGNIYDENGNPFITINTSGGVNYNSKLQTNYAYSIVAICSKNYINSKCILIGITIGIGGGLLQGAAHIIQNYPNLNASTINDYLLEHSDLLDYILSDKLLIGSNPTYNKSLDGILNQYLLYGKLSSLPDNWYKNEYSYFKDWSTNTTGNLLPEGGNSYYLAVKWWIPTTMPTKWRCYVDDDIWLYINDELVLHYGNCPNNTYTIDFTPYIKLGEINKLCICSADGNGDYYSYSGFVD